MSVSKFVKATLALVKGDADEKLATRNARSISAALKGQVSAQEGALVHAENDVEKAQEALETAIHSVGVEVTNAEYYIENVAQAQAKLRTAEEKVKGIQEALDLFKGILDARF